MLEEIWQSKLSSHLFFTSSKPICPASEHPKVVHADWIFSHATRKQWVVHAVWIIVSAVQQENIQRSSKLSGSSSVQQRLTSFLPSPKPVIVEGTMQAPGVGFMQGDVWNKKKKKNDISISFPETIQ